MIRFAALLVIVGACGLFGLLMAQRYALRPKQLREFHQAVETLQTEISYGATPLPQALKTAATGLEASIGGFFTEVARRIEAGFSAEQAWHAMIEQEQGSFCLSEADWQIMRTIGNGLGTTDCLEETKKLRLASIYLTEAEAQAKERSAKLTRLWSYSGFLIGATIALVIL
ncbi:MAG TPA: hypothetical protein VHQ46_02850 [Desulfobacteria bacterium]|nr:hypothetical protein [Desulfobacteria bacterium]